MNEMSELTRRLLTSIIMFAGLILLGTIGYMTLAETNFFESLYMTIITLTTVGYGETIQIQNNISARSFTMLLLLAGMGITLYFASTLTAFLVEGELKHILWKRKMAKKISQLSDHIILVGGGQTATYAIEELLVSKRHFVVIEKDETQLEHLLEQYRTDKLLGIIGDATVDEVLLEAGIETSKGIIITLPSDRDNLFVTITARGLNPNVRIIGKVVREETTKKMIRAGADKVICPDSIGGLTMVSQMLRPHAVLFLDTLLSDRGEMRIEEIHVTSNEVLGQNIMQLNLRQHYGNTTILALRPAATEDYIYNPPASRVLEKGDILIVMGNIDWIRQARGYFEN